MELEKLTATEEEIMQQIWLLQACTVSQLIADMPPPHPPHSTISSVVRILERKGFVGHKAYGRTYEYFPIIQKEAYAEANVDAVLENYFGGSLQQLVSSFVKKEKVDDAELERLKKMLDEL